MSTYGGTGLVKQSFSPLSDSLAISAPLAGAAAPAVPTAAALPQGWPTAGLGVERESTEAGAGLVGGPAAAVGPVTWLRVVNGEVNTVIYASTVLVSIR